MDPGENKTKTITSMFTSKMSFFRRSSRRHELSRPSSVQSFIKEELNGIVMRFQEDEQHKNQKNKLVKKKSKQNILGQQQQQQQQAQSQQHRPTTSSTIPPTIENHPPSPGFVYDVTIIGAGPAGLALAANLIRFGINVLVVDNRSERTVTGRADSLQPKTIETLRQMRLADRLLLKGVKVNDFRFWSASPHQPLSRMLRDLQFPCDQVDTIDPYLLTAHQGFIEDVFLRDMLERGSDVSRNLTFVDYHPSTHPNAPMEVVCESTQTHQRSTIQTHYLIGCDGAHSNVGRAMGARQVGGTKGEVWAVIDGVLETDFPDVYSKTVVHSREGGTAVLFPRERNMTRLYVEMKSEFGEETSMKDLSQEYAMQQAAEIFEPYTLKWKSLEWFGRHQISHRTASKFLDNAENGKVFLAGDAAHAHSPLSFGMNTSIADSWNLAWKLNLAIRRLSKAELLGTYEDERRQVADNLLDFDHEQVNSMLSGDSLGFAENAIRNARFASGYGADYAPNILNVPQKGSVLGQLRVGSIPPAAKVSRFVDATPVDLQVDIPMLGQFRIFFFTRALDQSMDFLSAVSTHILTEASVLGRATRATNASYALQPPIAAASDDFIRPERYTTVSGLCTFGIVLRLRTEELEIADLPALWRESKFTVYLDDVPHLDTRGMTCTEKWLGGCSGSEVDIVVIRPDGVVGTMYRGRGTLEHAVKACTQLDSYFEGFLTV